MKIIVTDPATNEQLELEARPEQMHHEFGYRIIYPNGSNFFISNRLGTWNPADDHHVDTDLLVQIGMAIEGQQQDSSY